jgi:hypothetical protein
VDAFQDAIAEAEVLEDLVGAEDLVEGGLVGPRRRRRFGDVAAGVGALDPMGSAGGISGVFGGGRGGLVLGGCSVAVVCSVQWNLKLDAGRRVPEG